MLWSNSPTRTIEGKVGYVGETDVRIDTSAHGQSWDNEVINKQQFEQGLRQSATAQRVDKMLAQAEAIAKESEVPEYERFSVRKALTVKCRFLLSGMIFMMTTMKPITPFHSFLTRSRQNLIWKI